MKVKQVAHVCIFAKDLEETKAFYADVLGMDVVFNFTRDGKVFGYYLGAGGRSHVEVFHKEAAEFSEMNQINHMCFEVESMTAAVDHLKARDIAVRGPKKACDDTWQAWVTDPNGVKIELFEYTPRSAQFVGGDRVADW
jgi:lactoylglutathione lyase/glyoxylase I family protein